jgi:hypothetical protein
MFIVLAEVIRKLHESFIALAGQIQASHEAVKVQHPMAKVDNK